MGEHRKEVHANITEQKGEAGTETLQFLEDRAKAADEEMKVDGLEDVDEFGVPVNAGKDDIEREDGPNGAYDNPFPIDEEDYLNTMKWYDRKEDGDDLEA